ncbi:hypothetical protein AB205_0025680, partial [Aquarana catesbeiana]
MLCFETCLFNQKRLFLMNVTKNNVIYQRCWLVQKHFSKCTCECALSKKFSTQQ